MDPTLVILLVVLVLSIVAGPALGFWFARRRLDARDRQRLDRSQRFAQLDDRVRHYADPMAAEPASGPHAFAGAAPGGPMTRDYPVGPRRFDLEPPIFGAVDGARDAFGQHARTPAGSLATGSPTVTDSPTDSPIGQTVRPSAPAEPPPSAATSQDSRTGPDVMRAGPQPQAAPHVASPSSVGAPAFGQGATGSDRVPNQEAGFSEDASTSILGGTITGSGSPRPDSVRPDFRPVSELAEDRSFHRPAWLADMPSGRVIALHRLGYDDPVKMANLRPSEVSRLAQALAVPTVIIENEWMPAARRELGIRNPAN